MALGILFGLTHTFDDRGGRGSAVGRSNAHTLDRLAHSIGCGAVGILRTGLCWCWYGIGECRGVCNLSGRKIEPYACQNDDGGNEGHKYCPNGERFFVHSLYFDSKFTFWETRE